ncbi:MAG: hypothetical protein JOZ73_12480 [Solirubrobacterales bacterium]|nr:hypothetical protein [Solirubrobacterales bacterium]
MKANRAFHLIVSRENPQPAYFADPHRMDRIEIVSIDDGEVVLFWELPAVEAARMLKSLRTDLAQLDATAFIERWEAEEPEAAPEEK